MFFLISCGGGSSSSSNQINLEINNTIQILHIFIPPSGKSIDNCVAQKFI